MRLTTYLLLAAFLRLQAECCHCAHDVSHHGAEHSAANVAAHQHEHSGHHAPCDECHLCRLSQQSYLSSADLPALDPPAVVEVIAPQSWVLDFPARIAVTHSSSLVEPSLIGCGSLLRI